MKADKAFTFIPFKYIDFADVFSKNLAAKLSEYNKINDYAIDLVKDQHLSYELIYTLEPIK